LYNVLKDLANGNSPEKVAKSSRDFLTKTYLKENLVASGAELGFSINNSCNLRCKHCYYPNTHENEKPLEINALSSDEWHKLTLETIDAGFKHISIVGKEPFLVPEKLQAILDAVKIKEDEGIKGLQPEILTNGILLPENINWLSKYNLHFLSVSFDGFKEDHDKIRGEGNYEKAKLGLESASKAGIKNLAITFTAMPHNVDSLDKMLKDLAKNGARYASIGFCFDTNFNQKDLKASTELFYKVIDKLKDTPKEFIDISLNLIGDEHGEIIAKLYKDGFFDNRKLAVTEDLAPSLIVPLFESPRTYINVGLLPTMFLSGYRVDYDGKAMDFCADIQQKCPKGFGNIKKSNVTDLYLLAKEKYWPKYSEDFYKRFSDAFKGNKLSQIKPSY